MLVTAINYQNNMSYALAPVFPGQQSEFVVQIERGRPREHFALALKWPDSTEGLINLVDEDRVQVHLHLPVGERGWHSPGRLLLESTYPLGSCPAPLATARRTPPSR